MLFVFHVKLFMLLNSEIQFFGFLVRRGLVLNQKRKIYESNLKWKCETLFTRKKVTLQTLKDYLKTKDIVTLYRQSLAPYMGLHFTKKTTNVLLMRHYFALMQSVCLNKYI